MSVKTKVLIIGAGPTGLMAACLLERFGIDHVIIDKKDGPTVESRALLLHARSLEIYDQLGIANNALLQGEILEKFQMVIKNKKVREVPLGKIGEGVSPFPFVLVLEQSKNEALLLNDLLTKGGEVKWDTELISLAEHDGEVQAVVSGEGELYDIHAEYLLAADGASSMVRKFLELPFEGDTYQHKFYVADTKIETRWHDVITLHLSPRTFVGIFPMQGTDRFRVIGILPPGHEEKPEEFSELVPVIEQQLGAPLKVSETSWFSVYHLHHRCMEHFRYGRIFFAGDAGHIHSPAGGQGMNTGLQDAYNLCWKLAMVAGGYAGDHLLNTYEQERLPVARKLLHSTDRAFSLVTSPKWLPRFYRLYLLPFLFSFIFRFRKWRLKLFSSISQTGIRYVDSDLTVMRITEPLAVKAGERFPYLKTAEGESVYQLMKTDYFHALVFAVNNESQLGEEISELSKEKGKLVHMIDLSAEVEIMKLLKIKTDTVILVRPDRYIGLITDEGGKVVRDYLAKLLVEKKEEPLIKLPRTHA